jgi:uncharacterized protein
LDNAAGDNGRFNAEDARLQSEAAATKAPKAAARGAALGFGVAAVVSGCVWALWHYPIILFADYNPGSPKRYAVTCFTALIVADSFVFAWMRLKSESLWTGVFLHASHNLFIQVFYDPMTVDRGQTAYFATEFGAFLPIVCLAVAIYFWTRRGELEQATR